MSAFGDTVSKYIPIARKRPQMDKKDVMSIVPVRNHLVDWEHTDKGIVLTIPMRDDRFARIVKKLMKNLPDTRQIQLDDVGSTVWELCDTEHNVDSIVKRVSNEYKLTRREAEASVTMFLQTLAKKNLIGLMSPGGKKSAKRNG